VRHHLLVTVVLLSAGCAPANLPPAPLIGENADPPSGCAPVTGSSGSSVIAAAELQRTGASNLYDAVLRLRPSFLLSREPSSVSGELPEAIVVIVNRHVIGGLDELRRMDATHLSCIRRLPAAEVSGLTGTFGSVGIEVVR
jgi:hypothetical protein